MANTSYTSILINNANKESAAYDAIITLIQHVRAGTGGYPIHVFSIVFDQLTKIITIVLSDPLPADQITRYGLTQVL